MITICMPPKLKHAQIRLTGSSGQLPDMSRAPLAELMS